MKRSVPRLSGISRTFGKGELIGLEVTVLRSADAGLAGLTGDIVDETLHTLTLRIGGPGGRRIQVPKVAGTFGVRSDPTRDWVEVDGAAIQFRSEDRTKKVR